MTPRSLFTIILKVFGLLFLKDALVGMPQIFPPLVSTMLSDGIKESFILLILIVLGTILYGLFPYYFIFKPHWIIDKLKLDQGFDQEVIPLAVHRSTILSVVIIVIGGMLVANELPNLMRLLLYLSQERRDGQMNPETSYLLLTVAKIVVGMLLITKQNQLVNYIELQRRK